MGRFPIPQIKSTPGSLHWGVAMALTQFWRCLICLPPALVLMAETLPQGVLAGSGPLDNNGRIACDPNGLIASPWQNDPGQRSAAQLHPGAMATVPAVCPVERSVPTGGLLTPGGFLSHRSPGPLAGRLDPGRPEWLAGSAARSLESPALEALLSARRSHRPLRSAAVRDWPQSPLDCPGHTPPRGELAALPVCQ